MMSAVHQRPRQWNSRLNSAPNNVSSAAASTMTNDSLNQICGQNQLATSKRLIYGVSDVKLRNLPFYDLICDVVRPAGLISDQVVGRLNESELEFKLTIEQADTVAMAQDSRQILLRFCYLDSTTEQDDNFPPEVVVTVNGSNVTLPQAISNPNKPNLLPKRPGQHVDITKYCKLCPFIQNVINIKWFVDPTDPTRTFVASVLIGQKVSAETLLKRIRDRGLSNPETTKRIILDSDAEVATMNLQSPLTCPLGKMRMSMPCKSIKCQHIPCFDALVYLQMNEKKASWICPICYKPAYFPDLIIDGFFMDILDHTDPSVTEVTLNLDGSWTPVVKMEQPSSAKNSQFEIITISDDDD